MKDNHSRFGGDDKIKERTLRYMLSLAAPMIVTHTSFTLMQFIDRFMVSRLGTDALAAVLPAGLVAFLPASFAIGVFSSINIFASQSLGKGRLKDCSAYCWQGIFMGICYAACVIAILWPLCPAIFAAMRHEPGVIKLEVTYLRILLYCQVPAVIIWTTSQFFIGVHRPIIIMYASLISQVVNVAANYVLIFGKFGLPAMGIAGAGWGTFIGLTVGVVLRLSFFLNGQINLIHKTRSLIYPQWTKMKQLLRVGLPTGAAMLVNTALWGVCLFWLVGLFGKESLAATSAVFSCIRISAMPIIGLSVALTAAIGKSIGNGHLELVKKQTGLCFKIAVVYMGIAGILFFLFRDGLMHFWSVDDKVIQVGRNIMIFAAIFQVFDAATIVYTGALRGAGDTLWLAITAICGSAIILCSGGFALVKFAPQLGPLGPWIAATVNIIALGLVNRWRFKSNIWMKLDIFKKPAISVALEPESIAD